MRFATFLCIVVLGLATCSVAADKVDVGFEGGLSLGRLPDDYKAKLADQPMQDLADPGNKGRWTFETDGGPEGYWGLETINSRVKIGPKPYGALASKKGATMALQTERVVFSDIGTGATMMMLTIAPHVSGGPGDWVFYYGKGAWNADGSMIIGARSQRPSVWAPKYDDRPGKNAGPLAIKSDGTGHHTLLGNGKLMRAVVASPTRPNIGYTASGNTILEIDLVTGKVAKDLGQVSGVWWLKQSPDDKYVMGRNKLGFWVIDTKTKKQYQVKLDYWEEKSKSHSVHDSYRFLPADTDWIMYWYERSHPGGGLNKEGFRLRNFKTGQEKIVPFRFDWNHGDVGRYMGYHCGGYITEWTGETFAPKEGLIWPTKVNTGNGPCYNIPHATGGYAAHWPDDQLWAYADLYIRQPSDAKYLSEVSKMFAKPFDQGGRVNRMKVCSNNRRGRGMNDRQGIKSISLSRPNMSPDGTKLVFNSNVFNRDGIYLVVCALPLAPVDVKGETLPGGGAQVTWKAPKYHAEIVGYNVYRSCTSGTGFELITKRPVKGTLFIDARKPAGCGTCFYAVRSVESSKLESPLSAEVAAGPISDSPIRIFCDAEAAISAELDAPSPDAIWMNFGGRASNLHYIWQRRSDKAGSVKLNVDVPKAGKYYVVARMKGPADAAFTIGGQDISIPTRKILIGEEFVVTSASKEWIWATSDTAVELASGAQKIEITSNVYGSSLDCFYLATDKGFKPAGRIVAVKPAALKLGAKTAEGGVKLTWRGKQDARWYHYNIYCGTEAGFTPDQKTLIASPDGNAYLDWQVTAGQTLYYKITQVTLDGIESDASNEVPIAVK